MNNGFVGREGMHVLLSGSALTLPFCSAPQSPERESEATASPVAESLIREIEDIDKVWRSGVIHKGFRDQSVIFGTAVCFKTEEEALARRLHLLSWSEYEIEAPGPIQDTLENVAAIAKAAGCPELIVLNFGQVVRRWTL